MSAEEIRELLDLAGTFGLGGVGGGLVVYLILRNFIPSYLAEKGKNLATREDVGAITREIEGVKLQYAQQMQQLAHQNSLLVEEVRGRGQLRLAAVERRLQAHQEAFELWRKLVGKMHESTISSAVVECQEWWNRNCLYLSAGAREAFSNAYWAAHMHSSLLEDRSNPQAVKDNWDEIIQAGQKIVQGAELPPLGDREIQVLAAPKSKANPPLNTAASA